MRKGGDPFNIVLSLCFRVVVRVSVLSHVPRAIMHTSVVVCVGRLSCWGGGDRRGGGEGRGRGVGSSRSISLLFPQTPRPPLTPLVRAPRPRYLCLRPVCFSVPAPCDACVLSCAHVCLQSACVFDCGVCVCGYTAEVRKTIATSGGIEAVARAMTIHADDNELQLSAVSAIVELVKDVPAHIATAKAAGVVPLLQRAVAMGVRKGHSLWDPAKLLDKDGCVDP